MNITREDMVIIIVFRRKNHKGERSMKKNVCFLVLLAVMLTFIIQLPLHAQTRDYSVQVSLRIPSHNQTRQGVITTWTVTTKSYTIRDNSPSEAGRLAYARAVNEHPPGTEVNIRNVR